MTARHEYPLYLQLKKSLNAAFRGESLKGERAVEAWVHAFMEALNNLPPEERYPRGFIWHLANRLLDAAFCSPRDGLMDQISCCPRAFLRSILLVAGRQSLPFSPARST